MNTTITSFRIGIVSLLALGLAIVPAHTAEEKGKGAANEQSPLWKSLIGTWVLVGTPGQVGEVPAVGGRFKFITSRHWTITQADPETGVTIFHHGGTYTLVGDEYSEKIEYANESTKELIKQTLKFKLSIDGDTLTQIGVGNDFNEVWKRAK